MKGCIPAVVSSTDGIVDRGHQRGRGHDLCAPLLEEREIGLADLLDLHAAESKDGFAIGIAAAG